MFTTNLKEKPLPPGTQIVTLLDVPYGEGKVKKGSVGRVVQELEEKKFLVKLPDDREILFSRDQITPQRDTFRVENIEVEIPYEQVARSLLLFEFVAGSTAYGLKVGNSDEDLVGSYAIPSQFLGGLKTYQETVVRSKPDAQYHEIGKLILLACKGNPNVMELGEIVKVPSLVKVPPQKAVIQEVFDRWYELFLSKYVFQAYQGYAIGQFKKMEKDLENHGEIRWKHASHLLRLLWSGKECMRTGVIVLRPGDVDEDVHRKLLEVKNGEWSEKQIRDWRLSLEKEFQEEFDRCNLPDRANFDAAHDLLLRIREEYRR